MIPEAEAFVRFQLNYLWRIHDPKA